MALVDAIAPQLRPRYYIEIKERYLEVREVGTDAVITVVEVLSPRLECFYLTRVEKSFIPAGGYPCGGKILTQLGEAVAIKLGSPKPTLKTFPAKR